MTQRIVLREYQRTTGLPLTAEQASVLQGLDADLTIEPSGSNRFDITPGSKVGVLRAGNLVVEIGPKLPIERLLFIISYALDPANWRSYTEHFEVQPNLVEAIMPGFLWQVESALSQGVQHGYLETEESGWRVRGRLRLVDQMRRHYGRDFPLEVRYDDFTPDIEINRLIKAAVHCIERIPRRNDVFSPRLRRLRSALEPVSLVSYDTDRLPSPTFTRLNERYRPAVELSKLLISSTSFDVGHGAAPATAFLVDMNQVFEDFVVTALREALGVSGNLLAQGRSLWLDEGHRVELQPDLSWWDGDECSFVGDVKYKRSTARGGTNADLYQLLAYLSATGLDHGLLVYAAGEATPIEHVVRLTGGTLEVVALDLTGPPHDVLEVIRTIAVRVATLRRQSANHDPAMVSC